MIKHTAHLLLNWSVRIDMDVLLMHSCLSNSGIYALSVIGCLKYCLCMNMLPLLATWQVFLSNFDCQPQAMHVQALFEETKHSTFRLFRILSQCLTYYPITTTWLCLVLVVINCYNNKIPLSLGIQTRCNCVCFSEHVTEARQGAAGGSVDLKGLNQKHRTDTHETQYHCTRSQTYDTHTHKHAQTTGFVPFCRHTQTWFHIMM